MHVWIKVSGALGLGVLLAGACQHKDTSGPAEPSGYAVPPALEGSTEDEPGLSPMTGSEGIGSDNGIDGMGSGGTSGTGATGGTSGSGATGTGGTGGIGPGRGGSGGTGGGVLR